MTGPDFEYVVSLGAEHGKRKIETSPSHDSFVLDDVNLRGRVFCSRTGESVPPRNQREGHHDGRTAARD
jgi:hypothetical protein